MKNQKFLYVVLICIALQSCCLPPFDCNDDFVEPFSGSNYEPVFLNRTDFEKSVSVKNSLAIGTSGKIYVKDNLLFINELNKGFHVYDNADPANPKAIKFLEAPGSTDLAIRRDMIYINQATDLIAVEYNSETNTANLTKRIPNTFPQLRSPDGFDAYDVPENSVVVDWKLKN
ncbi:hypothetical protein FEE95_19270 [Maribacter algarum]|uniref:LVIVD repeat-containing protein n=1 Tax=Maribacter algarum (ex Zhang et al. 2020) TaxID=2578118 RepID=A0A5S3PGF2_9FLAO|nr:hypothetical protein [Maribacter algarum]TMM53210.1 hypothetical protein FEE95_19270 [Maribacter algarum]